MPTDPSARRQASGDLGGIETDGQRSFIDVQVEGENDCTDPFASCEQTLLAIGDDFPDHVHTTVGNDRAQYLAWKRRMDDLIGGENSPSDYLEI